MQVPEIESKIYKNAAPYSCDREPQAETQAAEAHSKSYAGVSISPVLKRCQKRGSFVTAQFKCQLCRLRLAVGLLGLAEEGRTSQTLSSHLAIILR